MHCKPRKIDKLSFWLTIAIAIFAAISAESKAQDDKSSRFVVDRNGAGRPVLFIPGLASAGDVWDTAAAAIVDDHDVHIVTLAGFGNVPAVDPISPYIDQAVDALTDYLDKEELQDVVLVGHSMGAQISLQLAAARPGAVGQVLVVDSAPFYAALFNPTVTVEAAGQFGKQLGMQMANVSREQFLGIARQGLAVQSITESGRQRVMAYLGASDQAAVAQAMSDVAGSDFRPVLAHVSAPVTVLVAWSEGAPYSSERLRAIYEEQYADLSDVDVRIVSDARHFIMLDQPDVFAAELGEMLTADHGGKRR